jgi:hypothetical protein
MHSERGKQNTSNRDEFFRAMMVKTKRARKRNAYNRRAQDGEYTEPNRGKQTEMVLTCQKNE